MSTTRCFEHHWAQFQLHRDEAVLLQQRQDLRDQLQRPGCAEEVATKQKLRQLEQQLGEIAQKQGLNALGSPEQQWKLAARELKEACRIRPHHDEPRRELGRVERLLASLQPGQTVPMARFASFFNLSLRYWDLGKSKLAIEQARRAVKFLEAAGQPPGCAVHTLDLMQRTQESYARREAAARQRVRAKPKSVQAQYALGVVWFDKRHLALAEQQLARVKELCQFRRSLAVEQDHRQQGSRPASARPATRMLKQSGQRPAWDATPEEEDLRGVADDLEHVRELKQLFCPEESALDSGQGDQLARSPLRRCGAVKLLPCMLERFDVCADCAQWFAALAVDARLAWR